MSSPTQFAAALKPLLNECGYTGTRLATGYTFGDKKYPLVGFATKPWDFDSACIAVVEANGDPLNAAKDCRDLGAPIVWVTHNGTVDWWMQHGTAPTRFDSKPIDQFRTLVRQKKANLDPLSVYRAKTLGRLAKNKQLEFVDIGLMPLLREESGQKLGGLVEEMTRVTLDALGQTNPSKVTLRYVFTCVFRLLAGKILRDKNVGDFSTLDLGDVSAVLTKVAKHYGAAHADVKPNRQWKTALKPAAGLISAFGDLRVVSPETLAHVYEHALVSKALRKKLGIHATPPWLVDYMVWQLYDWIREIPVGERHVFEPACGHAPFLLAVMRLLRLEMQEESEAETHSYLQKHIHGVELDDFAREIARLSLTLADIPNPNGWDLTLGDMYESNMLAEGAAKCRVLLSNPPYEKFEKKEKQKYMKAGYPVSHKKAVELLHRTLPRLPQGAVFGAIVPQTVTSGPEAKQIREILLRDFEIREVCRFPGSVFEFAEMETAVILGRRHSGTFNSRAQGVRLRSVGKTGMSAFKERYWTEQDTMVMQARLSGNADFALTVPALDDVWTYLDHLPRICEIAMVGRGIEFKGEQARNHIPVVVAKPKVGYPAGYAGVERHQFIFKTPPIRGIAVKAELIENRRQGMPTGQPQILLNYGRTARSPWRIKSLMDSEGKPIKNNFAVIRAINENLPAEYLWAVLNSPVANAYCASRTDKRHNLEGILAQIPVPPLDEASIQAVVRAARVYRDVASRHVAASLNSNANKEDAAPLFEAPSSAGNGPSEREVHNALLKMDAIVLELYRLPLRLERQLLDYFRGHPRRGVGCEFGDYFPADFESLVPLHKFISPAYRNSTVEKVAARMKPGESAEVLKALRAAADAFGEE